MKTITRLVLFLMLSLALPLTSQTTIFEENFSYVTGIWYGKDYVVPDNEYDMYFDNPGWTGFTVSLGAPTEPGTTTAIPSNEINKPRVGVWKQAAYIVTPTINCPAKVILKFKLRRVARSTSLTGTWDEPNVNILHAPDGVNFSVLQTVTLEKKVDFTSFEIAVDGATSSSKFKFSHTTTANPNRFFIDAVVVTPDNTSDASSLHINSVSADISNSDGFLRVIMPDISLLKSVSIYDISGNKILSTNDDRISLKDLANGLYLVQIQILDGNYKTLKFLR